MSDDQRRGLVADLTRRLSVLDLDSVRVLDRIALRIEQLRFTWLRREATGPNDIDTRWHLSARVANGAIVTRCHGRWAEHDLVTCVDSPPVTERCLACQRAAWRDSASELDPLIATVLEQLAADDLATANLREAARAEMLGEGVVLPSRLSRAVVEARTSPVDIDEAG